MIPGPVSLPASDQLQHSRVSPNLHENAQRCDFLNNVRHVFHVREVYFCGEVPEAPFRGRIIKREHDRFKERLGHGAYTRHHKRLEIFTTSRF